MQKSVFKTDISRYKLANIIHQSAQHYNAMVRAHNQAIAHEVRKGKFIEYVECKPGDVTGSYFRTWSCGAQEPSVWTLKHAQKLFGNGMVICTFTAKTVTSDEQFLDHLLMDLSIEYPTYIPLLADTAINAFKLDMTLEQLIQASVRLPNPALTTKD